MLHQNVIIVQSPFSCLNFQKCNLVKENSFDSSVGRICLGFYVKIYYQNFLMSHVKLFFSIWGQNVVV